jgi:sulfur relay (sulfurtransferase) complex TusBCD TusD component (DsrE family)
MAGFTQAPGRRNFTLLPHIVMEDNNHVLRCVATTTERGILLEKFRETLKKINITPIIQTNI